jgi:hypothetical protein
MGMLQIVVPATELFDENTQMFIQTPETTLKLEHSLLSISKWESKWCKPFLLTDKKDQHTVKEMIDYVRCMTLNNNVPKEVYNALTRENMRDIQRYIDSPMTATTVKKLDNKPGGREIITSEIIYYWMISCNIPFECEKWHINRLIMLIKVCNAKNNPKKMSRNEILRNNRALNDARRRMHHTKG